MRTPPLVPCPKCGAPAEYVRSKGWSWVRCTEERLLHHGELKDTKREAIKAWNRRDEDDS